MDLDDDLLALAGGSSTKRSSKSKSSRPKPSKRKRPATRDDDSASDMDMSSDDDVPPPPPTEPEESGDEDSEEEDVLYPLEGKFKDEHDRAHIMSMSELDRENIIGERLEEVSKLEEKRALRRMVRAKERGASFGGDVMAKGARERRTTGVTAEKSGALERLKRSREQKGKKQAKTSDSEDGAVAKRHRASYSDDEDDKDYSGEDDRHDVPAVRSRKSATADFATMSDLKHIFLKRSRLADIMFAPFFQEYVKGAFVRIVIGVREREQEYRVAEIVDAKEISEKSYLLEGKMTNWQLMLRIGRSKRPFTMEGISNSPPTDREMSRYRLTLENEGVQALSVKDVQKIQAQLDKHKDYVLTEADLATSLAKRGAKASLVQGKAKLLIQRDFARSSGNAELAAQVEAELAALDAPTPSVSDTETEADRMRKVNERNRAVNREEIKRAEARTQEERMKLARAVARGEVQQKVDQSARVKTMTRLKYDRDTPSRPSTPQPGTPNNGASTPVNGATTPKSGDMPKPKAFNPLAEAAKKVQLDLDLDF